MFVYSLCCKLTTHLELEDAQGHLNPYSIICKKKKNISIELKPQLWNRAHVLYAEQPSTHPAGLFPACFNYSPHEIVTPGIRTSPIGI